MRKFYFENERGERWGLNREKGAFLRFPSGLGISRSAEFYDLGHGFFKAADARKVPQGNPAGEIVFHGGDPYALYQQLVNWIARCREIYFVYDPNGTEYRRKVELEYLTKTELGGPRWMTCPVSLRALTPWFIASPTMLQLQTAGDDVARCDISCFDVAVFAESVYPGMGAAITPAGHVPAALALTYEGAIINPVIRLVGQVSGETFGTCALTLETQAGEALILDTRYDGSGIWRRTVNGTLVNELNAADLSVDPFPRVPCHEACTLQISSESPIEGTATAQVFYYFGGV